MRREIVYALVVAQVLGGRAVGETEHLALPPINQPLGLMDHSNGESDRHQKDSDDSEKKGDKGKAWLQALMAAAQAAQAAAAAAAAGANKDRDNKLRSEAPMTAPPSIPSTPVVPSAPESSPPTLPELPAAPASSPVDLPPIPSVEPAVIGQHVPPSVPDPVAAPSEEAGREVFTPPSDIPPVIPDTRAKLGYDETKPTAGHATTSGAAPPSVSAVAGGSSSQAVPAAAYAAPVLPVESWVRNQTKSTDEAGPAGGGTAESSSGSTASSSGSVMEMMSALMGKSALPENPTGMTGTEIIGSARAVKSEPNENIFQYATWRYRHLAYGLGAVRASRKP